MRVYKRHGGRFFRASFSFNNTKVSPEGVAKSAYMLKHATPQDYSRIFCSICWFFCVFDKRQRARYQIGKKIL
jgi:hypothetical protein